MEAGDKKGIREYVLLGLDFVADEISEDEMKKETKKLIDQYPHLKGVCGDFNRD